MASEKTLYWMAVIVLALGLGNSFVNAHPDWAQSVAERPLVLADRVSDRATNLISLAEMALGRGETGVARTQTAIARVQCRLALAQARLASRQSQITRIQEQRVRAFTRTEVEHVVICPRKSLGPDADDAPVAQIDDTTDTN